VPRAEPPHDEASANFFLAPLPELEEADAHAYDEFATAMLWTPGYTAERLSNLGGPQRKIHPGMPPPVVVVERATPPSPPVVPTETPRPPSVEDRAATSRRVTESAAHRTANPVVVAVAYTVAMLLVVLLIFLWG
jgi:hypothetical protein